MATPPEAVDIRDVIREIRNPRDLPLAGNKIIFMVQKNLDYQPNITLDLEEGGVFRVAPLTGNVTFENPVRMNNGASGVMLIEQDATGGRTATWGSAFRRMSGENLDLTATAGAIDIFSWVVIDDLVFIAKAADWVAV